MGIDNDTTQRPWHISMLAPFGIRPKGTLAVRMLPLAQALVRRGHRVSIVAPPVHNPEDAGTHTMHEGVSVFHTPVPTLPHIAGVVQQVYSLWWYALHAQPHKPDVLHLFKPKGYSGLATLLVRYLHPRLPVVVDTDDWEGWGGWNDVLPYPLLAKKLFAWQERDVLRRAHAVTVASHALETLVWSMGIAPERVYYVPNGVYRPGTGDRRPVPELVEGRPGTGDQRPVPERGGATIVLYTRFWDFDVRDVVAALVAILQQCPTARLLVIGKGERGEEQLLLCLAQRAGIAHAIDYRGWVAPETIPSLLASADIALAPMDDTLINRARCSVKLLELMLAGLPIVAGRVGEVTVYIQDGVNGLLVPPSDSAALAHAVVQLIGNADIRSRMGIAARERVCTAYRWEHLVLQAERAYYWASSAVNLSNSSSARIS